MNATLLEKYNALAIAIEDVIRAGDASSELKPTLVDVHTAIVREMLRVGPRWPDLCGYFAEAGAFETIAGIRVEFMRER